MKQPQNDICWTKCYICDQHNYCIKVLWADDFDPETRQPIGTKEYTCSHCLDPEVHEWAFEDLTQFIKEHVYSEGRDRQNE